MQLPTFRSLSRAISLATAAFLAIGLIASDACAGLQFNLQGRPTSAGGYAGDLSAHVEFSYTSQSSTGGYLTIKIENTSNYQGNITGFAFNLPGSGFTFSTIGGDATGSSSVTLSSNSGDSSHTDVSGYYVNYDSNSIQADALGRFDVGVLNDNSSFINGGSGNQSPFIANGGDRTFTLAVTGTGLSALTENAFLSAFSSNQGAGNGTQYFVARIQAVGDSTSLGSGSDFLIPTGSPGPIPSPPAVPEPSTLVGGLIAIVPLVVIGYRRRRSGHAES